MRQFAGDKRKNIITIISVAILFVAVFLAYNAFQGSGVGDSTILENEFELGVANTGTAGKPNETTTEEIREILNSLDQFGEWPVPRERMGKANPFVPLDSSAR